MYPYSPKLYHAVLLLILSIFLLSLCGLRSVRGWGLFSLLFGAVAFAILAAAVMWLLLLRAYDDRMDKMIELARLYSAMDEEARAAFAFQFPSMQYRMKRGEVRAFFEDTNVPIEMFKHFLKTSDSKYISPRRYWFTSQHPEWAWNEIKEWLQEHDKIYPDSAAGSHSWMWKGNSWEHLKAYWGVGLNLRDFDDEPVMHPPGYTPPPLAEEVGSD